MFSTGYTGTDQQPRDIVAYSGSALQSGTTITLWTEGPGGLQLNPQVLGIEVGMLVQGCEWLGNPPDNDPLVIEVNPTNIVISQSIALNGGAFTGPGDKLVIGWANTIHRYSVEDELLTLSYIFVKIPFWFLLCHELQMHGIQLHMFLITFFVHWNTNSALHINHCPILGGGGGGGLLDVCSNKMQ